MRTQNDIFKSFLLNKLNNYVVIDVETTGLDSMRDMIIEIAAVRYVDGQVSAKFNTLVNPGIVIKPSITKINGITNEMVCDSPNIKKALVDFNNFIKPDDLLIGHNVSFDIDFITNAFKFDLKSKFSMDSFDTYKFSRRLLNNQVRDYKLVTLCAYFDINIKPHRALEDCIATGELFETFKNSYYDSVILFLEDIYIDRFIVKAPNHSNRITYVEPSQKNISNYNEIVKNEYYLPFTNIKLSPNVLIMVLFLFIIYIPFFLVMFLKSKLFDKKSNQEIFASFKTSYHYWILKK